MSPAMRALDISLSVLGIAGFVLTIAVFTVVVASLVIGYAKSRRMVAAVRLNKSFIDRVVAQGTKNLRAERERDEIRCMRERSKQEQYIPRIPGTPEKKNKRSL